jgi:osmotically-inducible protein OsmY
VHPVRVWCNHPALHLRAAWGTQPSQEDAKKMKRAHCFLAVAAGCAAFLTGVAFAGDGGAPQASDATITHRVMGKLAVDDPEVARMIQVSTKDGVVTLSGLTFNGEDEAKVIRDAQSVEGVVTVKNRLSIQQ